jgi:hypothetical protein
MRIEETSQRAGGKNIIAELQLIIEIYCREV